MKEVWKFTYEHKGNSFDLKVYKGDNEHFLKIFFENKVVHEVTAVISDENKENWESTQDTHPFESLVDSGINWIRQVDQNNYFKKSV